MASNQLLWMAWTQAWQVSLLIVAVLAATRYLASNRPHLAHVLWLVVLVKCLTPPLLASPSGVFGWLQNHFATSDLTSETVPFSTAALPDRATEPTNVVVLTDSSTAHAETFSTVTLHSSRTWTWPKISIWTIAGLVWAAGVFVSIAVSAWRWTRCWSTIQQAEVETRDDLQNAVASLADRLRIRKRIGLLVTSSRIGPAVIGIWKPLILLPVIVVQGKTVKELEPILAHELVHVRRGDLWVGLAQVLSQSLWWFHPLVWLANRLLTRDAERCCDEEVIAELGCSPAQYARSLLDVLELKRTLQPVPAFPGVRPVDITSRRMERIMKLGQGSHKRTPWWCGLVMVFVAAMVLPGAPWTAAKDKQKQDGSQEVKEAKAIEWPALPAAANDADSVTKVYRLKDVLDRLQKDFGLSESEAKTKLEEILAVRTGVRGSKPPFAWSGRRLTVQTSARSHERIAEAIQFVRQNGAQFQIEMHIFTGSPEAIAKLKLDWKTPFETAPATKAADFRSVPLVSTTARKGRRTGGKGSDLPVQQASAIQSVETSLLLRTAEVDDLGARSVLEQIDENSDLSAISHPKILTVLGQQASLQIDKAADGKFTPRVRVFFSGLAIQVLPLPYKHDQIQLDFQLEQSEITKVNELPSQEGPNPESDKVQVPTLRSSKITTAYALKLDRTLLIRGLAPSEKAGKPVETLVMLRCSQPKPESQLNSEIKPNPDHESRTNDAVSIRSYAVADLVSPIPHVQIKPASATESPEARQARYLAIMDELKILSGLIKSAIGANAWQDRDGLGVIEEFPTNMSLVISHTEEVHQEIANLLSQLRRRFELQISFETHLVGLPDDFLNAWEIQTSVSKARAKPTLTPNAVAKMNSSVVGGVRPSLKATYLRKDDKEKLLQAADKHNAPRSMHLPKVTVFQGHSAEVHLGPEDGGMNLEFRPQSSAETSTTEKRVCFLEYAIRSGAKDATEEGQNKSAIVADGDSLLIDVSEFLGPEVLERTDSPEIPGLTNLPLLGPLFRSTPTAQPVRVHLLITPRILIVKDEEAVQATP